MPLSGFSRGVGGVSVHDGGVGDYDDDVLDNDYLTSGRRRNVRAARRNSAPYSLHPSEHMEMTSSGLPAVSAAALARVKGRSRASKPKLSVALRRGKWSPEEEDFTHVIVETFKEGVLPLVDGTTLRTYVSGQLHCAPMRITKKYAKDSSIGKQCYKRTRDLDAATWERRSAEARASISEAITAPAPGRLSTTTP